MRSCLPGNDITTRAATLCEPFNRLLPPTTTTTGKPPAPMTTSPYPRRVQDHRGIHGSTITSKASSNPGRLSALHVCLAPAPGDSSTSSSPTFPHCLAPVRSALGSTVGAAALKAKETFSWETLLCPEVAAPLSHRPF